jgi:hypothetical protein
MSQSELRMASKVLQKPISLGGNIGGSNLTNMTQVNDLKQIYLP